ncbi:MAG: hypothetical protein ACOVNY_07755 [Chitinophagaceae bacterium]
MTSAIIITICVLVLIAYIFDISAAKTKIPSVILLLLVGWCVKKSAEFFNIAIPDLQPILPILGTIGLILIVLEGSLELELNKQKLGIVKQSFIIALVPMIALACLLAFGLSFYKVVSFKTSLINVLPICIISSAIAIPSVRNLSNKNREFITYESSLSDIIGVVLFNFLLFNTHVGFSTLLGFSLEFIVLIIISFIATAALAYLLSKIKHHVKFIPIILLILLIYNIAKVYHLSALVFIMIVGLFLGNLDELKSNKYIQMLKPEILETEIHKFTELIVESTFLIRSLFFLLFGFLIKTNDIINLETLPWSILIVVAILIIRAIQLSVSKLPIFPLLFIAPRGLITVLLFLSIPASQQVDFVNSSLIIQIIVLSAFIMMLGLIMYKSTEKATD